jgi:hypothetical protein
VSSSKRSRKIGFSSSTGIADRPATVALALVASSVIGNPLLAGRRVDAQFGLDGCQLVFEFCWVRTGRYGQSDASLQASSSLLTDGDRIVCMSLTADDFEKYLRGDDDERPLGDALADLALDVETDAVGAVREIREQE